MQFVKFVEQNEHEGETWNFWLQLDGNEKELKHLSAVMNTFTEDGEEYVLDLNAVVTEDQVDTLVKHGGQGYMDYNNKITGVFTCPTPTEDLDEDGYWEWLNDTFYKGDIARYFK